MISERIKNKKILILGFGREGKTSLKNVFIMRSANRVRKMRKVWIIQRI